MLNRGEGISTPRFSPCAVIVFDPPAAKFRVDAEKSVIEGASYETMVSLVPVRMNTSDPPSPEVTTNARLCRAPGWTWHDTEV
eukprot:321749-Rhodomonas_salina.4